MYPYNNNRFAGYGSQGSPLNWEQAMGLAYDLFCWHSENKTDCWTESGDGADAEIHRIALGLMAQLAEPAFVQMLAAVGESVASSIETLAVLASRGKDYTDTTDVLRDAGIDIKRYLPPAKKPKPWWWRFRQ